LKICGDIDGKTRYTHSNYPKFTNKFKVYTPTARLDPLGGAPDPIGEDGDSDAAGQEYTQRLCINEVAQGEAIANKRQQV